MAKNLSWGKCHGGSQELETWLRFGSIFLFAIKHFEEKNGSSVVKYIHCMPKVPDSILTFSAKGSHLESAVKILNASRAAL